MSKTCVTILEFYSWKEFHPVDEHSGLSNYTKIPKSHKIFVDSNPYFLNATKNIFSTLQTSNKFVAIMTVAKK